MNKLTLEHDAAAPITPDRAAILRNAQKLLRIGKLEPAIELYEKVVRDSSDDLQTAATLAGRHQAVDFGGTSHRGDAGHPDWARGNRAAPAPR